VRWPCARASSSIGLKGQSLGQLRPAAAQCNHLLCGGGPGRLTALSEPHGRGRPQAPEPSFGRLAPGLFRHWVDIVVVLNPFRSWGLPMVRPAGSGPGCPQLPAGPTGVAGAAPETAEASNPQRTDEDSQKGRWPGDNGPVTARSTPNGKPTISVSWPACCFVFGAAVFSDHSLHPDQQPANRGLKLSCFLSAPRNQQPGAWACGPGCTSLTTNCRAAGRCDQALGHEEERRFLGEAITGESAFDLLGRLADPADPDVTGAVQPLELPHEAAGALPPLSRGNVIGRAFCAPLGNDVLAAHVDFREHATGNVTRTSSQAIRRASSPNSGAVNRVTRTLLTCLT